MAGISLEIARKHLSAWLEAELEVTTHQSYTIGSRSLTKADLADIRQQIEFWKNEVARLEKRRKARRAKPRFPCGPAGPLRP